jgi:hypothetical protein
MVYVRNLVTGLCAMARAEKIYSNNMSFAKVTVGILFNDSRLTIRVAFSEPVADVEAISDSIDVLLKKFYALRFREPVVESGSHG